MIVAASERGVIGRGGQLPWRIPSDLRRFKSLTMGHAMIVGRKTYDEVGKPLPGRRMIIVTRSAKLPPQVKRQIDENQQHIASQKRFIADREDEKKRINARFDQELTRLKVLWAQSGGQPVAAASASRKP